MCIGMVLEKAEMNLHEFLNRYGEVLSIENKLALFHQINEGLCSIHDENMIHFDLKPGNILMFCLRSVAAADVSSISNKNALIVGGYEWRAKIADFGCSCFIDGTTSVVMRKNRVGTVLFMAPEVVWQPARLRAQDGRVQFGQASDMWSLGVTMYCIAYPGRTPYSVHARLSHEELLIAIADVRTVIAFPEMPHLRGEQRKQFKYLVTLIKGCVAQEVSQRWRARELNELLNSRDYQQARTALAAKDLRIPAHRIQTVEPDIMQIDDVFSGDLAQATPSDSRVDLQSRPISLVSVRLRRESQNDSTHQTYHLSSHALAAAISRNNLDETSAAERYDVIATPLIPAAQNHALTHADDHGRATTPRTVELRSESIEAKPFSSGSMTDNASQDVDPHVHSVNCVNLSISFAANHQECPVRELPARSSTHDPGSQEIKEGEKFLEHTLFLGDGAGAAGSRCSTSRTAPDGILCADTSPEVSINTAVAHSECASNKKQGLPLPPQVSQTLPLARGEENTARRSLALRHVATRASSSSAHMNGDADGPRQPDSNLENDRVSRGRDGLGSALTSDDAEDVAPALPRSAGRRHRMSACMKRWMSLSVSGKIFTGFLGIACVLCFGGACSMGVRMALQRARAHQDNSFLPPIGRSAAGENLEASEDATDISSGTNADDDGHDRADVEDRVSFECDMPAKPPPLRSPSPPKEQPPAPKEPPSCPQENSTATVGVSQEIPAQRGSTSLSQPDPAEESRMAMPERRISEFGRPPAFRPTGTSGQHQGKHLFWNFCSAIRCLFI